MFLALDHLFNRPSIWSTFLSTKGGGLAWQGGVALLVGAMMLFVDTAWAQNGKASLVAPLSSSQIVANLERRNLKQAEVLESYKDLRHYEVVYRGFFKTITAKMDVEFSYDAASGKSYRIVAQSGSHMLCEKVLSRALDGEREASLNRGGTALTQANYRFQFTGIENVDGRPAYLLSVEPATPNQFLYRGNIWVDPNDFSVIKMEVQPAKNPSFWISRTLIHLANLESGGFCLPAHNETETRIRVGGTAVLTIDYGSYQIIPGRL
jgi:hypothetical protein